MKKTTHDPFKTYVLIVIAYPFWKAYISVTAFADIT